MYAVSEIFQQRERERERGGGKGEGESDREIDRQTQRIVDRFFSMLSKAQVCQDLRQLAL